MKQRDAPRNQCTAAAMMMQMPIDIAPTSTARATVLFLHDLLPQVIRRHPVDDDERQLRRP